MIDWTLTSEQCSLVSQIAERAEVEIFSLHPEVLQSLTDTMMDLTACNNMSVKLDFEALLKADMGDFAHDVCGIRRHINRQTGKLEGCFMPRFAKGE